MKEKIKAQMKELYFFTWGQKEKGNSIK